MGTKPEHLPASRSQTKDVCVWGWFQQGSETDRRARLTSPLVRFLFRSSFKCYQEVLRCWSGFWGGGAQSDLDADLACYSSAPADAHVDDKRHCETKGFSSPDL